MVIGVGGIGGYAVQICAALGASVVAVDVDPAKLQSVQQCGASLAIDPAKWMDELKNESVILRKTKGFQHKNGTSSNVPEAVRGKKPHSDC